MSLARDFFCGVGQCWLGDVIDSIWQFGQILLEFAIPIMQIMAILYMLYWVGLIIRTIKTGDPAPIVNHIMAVWHLLSTIANAFVNMVGHVIPF